MNWTIAITALLLAGFSYFLTLSVERYTLKRGILDNPNARSSHVVPTPRGGGMAIVVSFAAFIIAASASHFIELKGEFGVLLGCLLVAGIGWMDDRKPMSAKIRLIVHAIASSTVVFCLWNPDQTLVLGPGLILTHILTLIFELLFLIWMTNLYNFMDGIDGLAAGQSVSVAFAVAALAILSGSPSLSFAYIALAAASGGFLLRNWAPAKIFMGDVGSGFLGFAFGALALLSASEGKIPLVTSIILMSVFIVDATFTLARRLASGQRVHEAHRDHAYQKAVQSGMSHKTVSMICLLINLAWLAPLGYAAMMFPHLQWAILAIAITPLILICIRMKAGVRT